MVVRIWLGTGNASVFIVGRGTIKDTLYRQAIAHSTPKTIVKLSRRTNMMPQTPDNNRHTWEGLEKYCRKLAKSGKELYIIAGPLGDQGMLKSRVKIPTYTSKIVVVLNNKNAGISSVTESTRVIAINVPNQQGINHDWRAYRVSVKTLSGLTGYHFLSNVPTFVRDTLEKKVDTIVRWAIAYLES